MTAVGKCFGHKVDTRTHQPSDVFVDPIVKVGVELELEEYRFPDSFYDNCIFWAYHDDPSLRGLYTCEIVLGQPLNGKDLDDALREACNFIATDTTKPVQSSRTSTHVHLDAGALSLKQLRDWILTYIVVERVLFRYCGVTRERSPFCVPLFKAIAPLEGLMYFCEEEANSLNAKLMDYANEGLRYGALNLNALYKHGSLEFRMLPARWRYYQLVEWVNILMCIRKYAVEGNLNLDAMYRAMYNDTPEKLLDEIFGAWGKSLINKHNRHDIVAGIRLARAYADNKAEHAPLFWSIIDLSGNINYQPGSLDKFNKLREEEFKSLVKDKKISIDQLMSTDAPTYFVDEIVWAPDPYAITSAPEENDEEEYIDPTDPD